MIPLKVLWDANLDKRFSEIDDEVRLTEYRAMTVERHLLFLVFLGVLVDLPFYIAIYWLWF